MNERELDRAAMVLEARAHWMAKRRTQQTVRRVAIGLSGAAMLLLTIGIFC